MSNCKGECTFLQSIIPAFFSLIAIIIGASVTYCVETNKQQQHEKSGNSK